MMYLDDVYEQFLRAGNTDNDDFAEAINWWMEFWRTQGRQTPLTIHLRPRVYTCRSPIQVDRGSWLRMIGEGDATFTGYTSTASAFPETTTRQGPTLDWTDEVSGSTGYINIRIGLSAQIVGNPDNNEDVRTANSIAYLEGFCIRGPSNYASVVDPIDGIKLRSKAVIRNMTITRIPRHGIDGQANIVQETLDDRYGNNNNSYLERINLTNIGGSGIRMDGGDTNGTVCIGIDIANWGTNSNHATGSAAAGTSNVAAIWDSSFIMCTWMACHTGSVSNGHWKYVAADPGTTSVFLGCYQEGTQDSAIMFGNMAYGGILSPPRDPPVIIQEASGMHPTAIGKYATVNRMVGGQLSGAYEMNNPFASGEADQSDNYKDGMIIGGSVATPGGDTFYMQLRGNGDKNGSGLPDADPDPWRLVYKEDADNPRWAWAPTNSGGAESVIMYARRFDPTDSGNDRTAFKERAPWQFPWGVRLGSGLGSPVNVALETGDPAIVSGATRDGNAVILLATESAFTADPDARKPAFGFAAAIPTGGTWSTGDVLFDSTGASAGWVCTAGGMPGSWATFSPSWSEDSGNIARATGSVVIGGAPGDGIVDGLSVLGKSIAMRSTSGELEIACTREDIPGHNQVTAGDNPTFGLMRVYTAGIGQPAYRVVYRDDSEAERTIWSGESTGTHASVGDGTGKPYFEWYYEDGEVVPMGRIMGRGTGAGIERFQYQHLELAAGDSSEVDVFLGRKGAGVGYLGWTADVSLGINEEATWESGKLVAVNKLESPIVDVGSTLLQQGNRDTYFEAVDNTDSPVSVGAREMTLVDANAGNVVLNLPDASAVYGRRFTFIRTDSSSNTVTIDGNGAQTIDGAAWRLLEHYGHRIEIMSTGAGWVIVNQDRRATGGAMSASGLAVASVTSPGKSAAGAGWVSGGSLSGFSYASGILTKTSPRTCRYKIDWSVGGISSGVTVTRASYAVNGTPVAASANQIETFTSYPPRAMSGGFHSTLSQGSTVELWLECFSGPVTLTADFATIRIEELYEV